ncbi:maltase-glucoamylase-like isoform X2 [Panulirus ornatus]|uniref:maltase-glucoamylase-like isoform X2 n=1 Tax=Panulirus ornatus TaxID=150431 RepID=UPI003A89C3D0
MSYTRRDTIDTFSIGDSETSGTAANESAPKPWLRLLKKNALQVLVLTAVVAVVAGTTIGLVGSSPRGNHVTPPDRIRCLEKGVNISQCLGVGCVWEPELNAPSCFFPPPSVHGYTIKTPPENPTPGVTHVTLALKNTSARVVEDLKEELLVEVTEYGGDILRIKVTVPGEARYEVPVPLQLPEVQGASSNSRYNVSFGAVGSDFALVVRRAETGAILFDTSDVGGLTFGDQYMQVSTRLASPNLYGFGEASHDRLKHDLAYQTWPMFSRDQPPRGVGKNMHGVHPLYMVMDGEGSAHAVLCLNSNAIEVETMPLPGLTLRAIGGVLDLYFFLGPSPKEALQQYARVVGLPALPPYWALGFQLSRYGYNSLDNLKAAVSRTRRHGIPQDVQYVDIDHMDRRMDFTYDDVNFAGLPQYIRDVKRQGLRFSVILDPAINAEMSPQEYPVHARGLQEDVYITWPQEMVPGENYGAGDIMLGYVWPDNRTAFPDYFRTSTRDWWQGEVSRLHETLEFDGLWLDMNEPTNIGTNEDHPSNWPEDRPAWSLVCPRSRWDDPPYGTAAVRGKGKRLSDKTLCMVGRQGEERELRHYDLHSLYGWSQTEPTLRGLQTATQKRGVVVSRATYPSSGRWAGHWLGYNTARWADLHHSIIGMLEFNMFAIPYVGADICGYFDDTLEDLCQRWMELGAFYPFSRNHNDIKAKDQDPGLWPSVTASGRAALQIRYTLLPYLYTLHHLASSQGLPVVRPLFVEFPNDTRTLTIDDQFLWGSWFMVVPVIKAGTTSRKVYFPKCVWYDYHNGTTVNNTLEDIAAPRTHVPVFVRGGGILVSQRPRANTLLSRREPFGLTVAPDHEGRAEGLLYWDDGQSIQPTETGHYFTANITYVNESIVWTVSHADGVADEMVLSDVRVFGVDRRPVHLLVAGDRWTTGDWHYDASTKVLAMYDLGIPIKTGFTLSWKDEMDFKIPCPISYKDWKEDVAVREAECLTSNCIWDPDTKVPCSIPPPSDYGFDFEDGVVRETEKGFRVLLKKRGPSLFGGEVGRVTFEIFRYSDVTLRFKFYQTGVERYEVPIELNLPDEALHEPLYEVVLPQDPEAGDLFFFYVVRRDTGTILFDTRIGGLTFSEQFLSVTTTLPSKNVYGMGENAHDSFRHVFKGETWPIFSRDQGPEPGAGRQVNLYGAHPYYQCLENDGRAHGVLLLNSNAMDYQMLDYPAISYRTIGGILDFYMMVGPEPESVVSQYTRLIHRPVMPPYWALGFQLCRYGYQSLEELQAAVNRTRDAGIPQDVQYGDIDYMSRRMDFTVDQEHFAGFPEYVRRVKEDGLRFIVILDPAINVERPAEEYPTHQRALAADAYIKWSSDTNDSIVHDNNGGGDLGSTMLGYVWPDNRTAFPNFFKTSSRDWWVQEIATFYHTVEFDGLWIDMNEPANFGTNEDQPWNWPGGRDPWSLVCPESRWDDPPYVTKAGAMGPTNRLSDKTLCLAASEEPYRHYDVHNLYGWAQTEPTHRAVKSLTGKRGLVVTRSTFPGSGHWAGHWLGDNRSNWTDMAHSITGMLEFNLFGMPYVGADICGFFQNTTEELCERWMELGAFYPYSRNHNQKDAFDQDPGLWPDTVGKSSKAALEIRYRLLPYLYTLFYQANTEGRTVVRPLLHEFPRDRRTLSVDDQFLWGSAFMISPVLQEGVVERVVYFPYDAWYDYYTGTPIEWPGEYLNVSAPRNIIPLHIRGGHVLPTQRPALNTQLSRKEPFGLLVAIGLDRRASGLLFWDDGEGIDTVPERDLGLVEFSFVQNLLTMSVVENVNGNLDGLRLMDLEFLGVEMKPSAIFLKQEGDDLLSHEIDLTNNFTYEVQAMRLRVAVDIELKRNFTIELMDIWYYTVDIS